MSEISANSSILSLAKGLREKKYSALELAEHYLARIHNAKALNAFITIGDEYTREQAIEADKDIATGKGGPFTGVPIAHKDIFCTKGLLTSAGSRILSNFVSPYDATVVTRLKNAGMVVLGKTNMDEFAMGSSNEHSYFGPVRNPWNHQCVPGGSSGGSAAAVAAGLAPIATATDTGGSIRQPAAFCGLTGIKPSYGRISRYGMIAFASSLDQAGVIGRSAAEVASVLQLMAGHDPMDATSIPEPCPDWNTELQKPLTNLRIGLPRQYHSAAVNGEVAAAVEQARVILGRLGASFVEVDLANLAMGIPCYYILAPAEASSNLARYDGVRYGVRSEHSEDIKQLYINSRSEGFGPEVKRRIMVGTYALSSGYYDAYYLKAQKLRRLITTDLEQAFSQCDLLLGPTTPATAFRLGEKIDDPIAMYYNDIFTNLANLAGSPAISVPIGFDSAKKPIGMQLLAPYLEEGRLLQWAHHYQQHTDWHLQTPLEHR